MQQHITLYTESKAVEPVQIHLVPGFVTPAQCRHLQALGLRIRRVLNRLLKSYAHEPSLQAVLPLTEHERVWLGQLAPKGFPDPATVFERLDTNLFLEDPAWVRSFRLLELNSVGVGCLHFMPTATQLVTDQLASSLQQAVAPRACRPVTDARWLLRRNLETHARAIGRKRLVIAFVERRETVVGGADEMLAISQWLDGQGLQTLVADPRELELRQGEIVYKDTTIDVVYRDCALQELISIEQHGGHVEAMKHAFARNQVVSALTGEFDHKSLFELLSSPEFAKRLTLAERRIFRACIPWTRLVRARTTTDPERREVDLPDFVRRQRDGLVLKPNRAYGGQDVMIGCDATQAVWEQTLEKALVHPDTWVVQAMAGIPRVEFLDTDHPDDVVSEFVTVGFVATPDGVALVGRSSAERIVNVSRGGGLVTLFVVT
ncbi:MAG: hypothetical protein HYZ92_04410 [Candidatus Omnitrophica bacterium]|nr:hypothetical protein [Candidatus Omnitrophota bacterium]